jgi:hypothetical protein
MLGEWRTSDVVWVVRQAMVTVQPEEALPPPAQVRARLVAFDLLSAASGRRAVAIGQALAPAIAPLQTRLPCSLAATAGRRQVAAPQGPRVASQPPPRVRRERWEAWLRLLQRAFALAG